MGERRLGEIAVDTAEVSEDPKPPMRASRVEVRLGRRGSEIAVGDRRTRATREHRSATLIPYEMRSCYRGISQVYGTRNAIRPFLWRRPPGGPLGSLHRRSGMAGRIKLLINQ
jgi:hypothetical protein